MKQIRVLIADDHDVVREGLRSVLHSSPKYRIVGEAPDGETAITMADLSKPDVIMMDITMPGMSGLEAISLLKEKHPHIRVISLTVHDQEEFIYRTLRAGAIGYLLKSSGKKEIFAAIEAAMEGKRFFSPNVSETIADAYVNQAKEEGTPKPQHDAQKQILSNRETEILQLIAEGWTNRRIAEKLFLSVRTVNTHRTNLMKKLDIHDTARLVHYAIENNLIALEK